MKHCDPRGNVLNVQQRDYNDDDMGDFGHLKLRELDCLYFTVAWHRKLID